MAENTEQRVPNLSTPGRTFGWWDMFVHPDEDPRGGSYHGERDVLSGYLRDYRTTLRLKCQGLDAEQLARRSVEPSTLSLLGLIRHLTDVERSWFQRIMAGEDVARFYPDEAEWEVEADPAMVAKAWADWEAAVAYSEEFVAKAESMDLLAKSGGDDPAELREVLVHMIEEYSRHCGHADLLRERIDGRVGQ
ncbi:MAG TPA: DinB family protein [Phytomonospora sp.]